MRNAKRKQQKNDPYENNKRNRVTYRQQNTNQAVVFINERRMVPRKQPPERNGRNIAGRNQSNGSDHNDRAAKETIGKRKMGFGRRLI